MQSTAIALCNEANMWLSFHHSHPFLSNGKKVKVIMCVIFYPLLTGSVAFILIIANWVIFW